MSPFAQLLLALAILLAAAKIGALLSVKLRQPAVMGELVMGVLLGPTALDLLHLPIFSDPHLVATISSLAQLGVVLLMFVAGLEIDLGEMLHAGTTAAAVGVSGVVATLLLVLLVALGFGYPWHEAAFIGVALTATSVSISAQMLVELQMLRSRVGLTLLGAAVIDDVLVLLIVSLFLALFASTGTHGLAVVGLVLLRVVLYFGVVTLLGLRFAQPVLHRMERLPVSQAVLSGVLIVVLLLAWSAEAVGGLAAITGAFLAGVLFGRTHQRPQIEQGIRTLAYGFLVPIFFIGIGLQADARSLVGRNLLFALAMIGAAIGAKLIGCGCAARARGFSWREAGQVGIGMVARGEVELIVATAGRSAGLIGPQVFAVVVLVVLVTTLLTPPLLKWSVGSVLGQRRPTMRQVQPREK